MIRRISEYTQAVMDQFRKGSAIGEKSGLDFLDPFMKIRPGFFYTVTGWPGSGKSEFIMQLCLLQAIVSKRRVAFYSPESYPVESFIATMAHCFLGKSTDKGYQNCCSESEFMASIDFLNEWVFLVDYEQSPDSMIVLEDFKVLHTGHNCKVFCLDPFNSLSNVEENGNMVLQLKNVLNDFVHFTHTNKIIFFCIEHPRTPRDPAEISGIPGAHQLFGGTMWWNKSDCLLAIQSIREDGKYTGQVIVKVWKMKNQKLNGRPGEVNCYFNIITNRYYTNAIGGGNAMELPKIIQAEAF